MRAIEYRGRSVADGKWVHGYFIQALNFENKPIKTFIIKNMSSITFDGKTKQDYYEVDPETVGQFTGYTTKDNTKVYDGDIVEFETNVNCITSELKPYWKGCYEKQYEIGGGTWWVRKDQAIVQWNASKGMWDLKVYNNGKYKRKSKLFTYRSSDYVVIGNIFDNKELIYE